MRQPYRMDKLMEDQVQQFNKEAYNARKEYLMDQGLWKARHGGFMTLELGHIVEK